MLPNGIYNLMLKLDFFSNTGLEVFGLTLKLFTLRTGSPSDHSKKYYNHVGRNVTSLVTN